MIKLVIAVGATGVIVMWGWPAEAERRSESYQFCQGAPDLCVVEGGERSYFEENFSLCWHRSRPADDPPPDPERDHVPGWPGSEEGAMCIGCDTQADWCRGLIVKGEEACLSFHEGVARSRCSRAWKRGERPRDRYRRPLEPSDSIVPTSSTWTTP